MEIPYPRLNQPRPIIQLYSRFVQSQIPGSLPFGCCYPILLRRDRQIRRQTPGSGDPGQAGQHRICSINWADKIVNRTADQHLLFSLHQTGSHSLSLLPKLSNVAQVL